MPFMVTTPSNNKIFDLQQLVYNQKPKGALKVRSLPMEGEFISEQCVNSLLMSLQDEGA
jgi:hypothetical protein